jgi:dihydrofolate synthase/folylpolyglutamate synthase
MNYNDTVNWMFNQLPMYQTQGASAYRKDLINTILLADRLGNPEKDLRCIHVAGTNGKGSTSHMLASILQEAGYQVGLYTSPHLKDFKERIKINGNEISEEFVTEFINLHRTFFENNNLSFFEMSVGLAFEYFKEKQVDIAIIEVGMGGRLDSTNIVNPMVSVITNIGMDHVQFLGNTLELIANEKAGIIKPFIPVVIGEYTSETKIVFQNKALEKGSEIFFASDEIKEDYPTVLLGNYQILNKKTVLKTIRVLQSLDVFKISESHIKSGLLNVIENTGLHGRWQQLQEFPKVICDTAHNWDGLKIVIEQILQQEYNDLHIVFGVVNDKELKDILLLFPKRATYYFCKPNIPRGLETAILKEKALENKLIGEAYSSVSEAYIAAKKKATKEDFIFVGGSTFVVAEILELN